MHVEDLKTPTNILACATTGNMDQVRLIAPFSSLRLFFHSQSAFRSWGSWSLEAPNSSHHNGRPLPLTQS